MELSKVAGWHSSAFSVAILGVAAVTTPYPSHPVESLPPCRLAGQRLKGIGRPFERNLTIGAITIAKSQQSYKPKNQIKHIEQYHKQGYLLPKMYCLMTQITLCEWTTFVEDKREQRNGAKTTGREMTCVYCERFHHSSLNVHHFCIYCSNRRWTYFPKTSNSMFTTVPVLKLWKFVTL